MASPLERLPDEGDQDRHAPEGELSEPMHGDTSPLLSCWPDGFSRYYTVARSLARLFEGRPVRVLDAGGNSEWMYRFLRAEGLEVELTVVDPGERTMADSAVRYQQADLTKWEHNGPPFDAVVSTDVLEHMPKSVRSSFIQRCLDLSAGVAVLAGPREDTTVRAGEDLINETYRRIHGHAHPWLEEHFKYGRCDFGEIRAQVEEQGWFAMSWETNNLQTWTWSVLLNTLNQQVIPLPGMDDFNRLYNATIHHNGDLTSPGYRTMLVAFKERTLYESGKARLGRSFDSLPDPDTVRLCQIASYRLVADGLMAAAEAASESRAMVVRLEEELAGLKARPGYRARHAALSLAARLRSRWRSTPRPSRPSREPRDQI